MMLGVEFTPFPGLQVGKAVDEGGGFARDFPGFGAKSPPIDILEGIQHGETPAQPS